MDRRVKHDDDRFWSGPLPIVSHRRNSGGFEALRHRFGLQSTRFLAVKPLSMESTSRLLKKPLATRHLA